MGCDIHICMERRVNDDKWWNCDDLSFNPHYGAYPEEGKYNRNEVYGNRDYDLFATLANVRNYGDTQYISEPKGTPADAHEFTQKCIENWGMDGHSHSYFTLKQLRDFKRHHPMIKEGGLISQEQAAALDNEGVAPTSWCQGSSDKTLVHRTWEVPNTSLDRLISCIVNRIKVFDFGLQYRMEDSSTAEVEKIIEKIQGDYRIVFWFDN